MESFEVQAILSAVDKGFTDIMKQAQKSTEGFEDTQKKAGLSFGNILKGVGVYKAVDLGINAITGSLGGAIDRFDTLNNSTRSFENMGFSAKETEKTMEDLKASIQGLPTPLDGAIKGVQLLASSTEDIGKSQKIFRALNDGILGFGGTTDQVNNAIIQLSQSFSNGKVDAETWNSMINSGLGPSLAAIAKTMNMTTGELKEGLSKGRVSVEEFQNALISLDENGGGGLKSLQQIAKDSTAGIKTGIANAKTAIVRGVANLISAVDEGLAKTDLKSIGSIIANIGSSMEKGLTQAAQYIPPILNAVGVAIKFVADNGDWLIPVLAGVVSGFVALSAAKESIKVISGIQKAFKDFEGIASLIGMIGPAGWIAIGIGAVVAAGILLYKNWDTVKTVASDVWNSVSGVFQSALDVISPILDALSSLFTTTWGAITSFWNENQQTIMSIVTTVWEAIKLTFETVLGAIVFYVQLQLTAIQVAFQVLQAVLTVVVQAMWAVVSNVFTGALNAILTVVTTVLNQVKNVFTLVTNTIQSIIKIFTSVFTGDWQGALDGVMQLVGGFKDFVVNSFKNITSMMGDLVRTGVDTVKNIFGDLSNIDLMAAGKAIIDSFTSGLKSAWEGTKDFIGGIGDWIVQHKGPISYDKKMLIPAGLAIMDGFNKSLTSGFSNVQSNLLSMNDELSDSFNMSSSLADVNGSMNSMIQHEVNMSGSKKSATFNIRLGNQQFSAFVDDISQAMGQDSEINLSF
ncbi:tape measure protein [Enterococcus sp. AZ102]|uniref:tape measure protein n=1 Tax=Enterococcus sp. AZ102 TaxID=2774865 RepID=UPI003F1FDE02